MKKKRLIAVLLAAVLAFSLSACGKVNASARPAGQFKRVTDAVSAYENGGQYVCDYEFIRSFAALPKTAAEEPEFDSWERTDSEDGSAVSFEKKTTMFGCEASVSVGIRKENQKIIAILMTFTEGEAEPFEITGALWKALSETAGGTYEATLDGETVKAGEISALIDAGDSTHSLRGIWPKNSIKWSVMLDYSVTDGNQQLTVYFL